MTQLSEESVRLYGEGIAGVIGWDLLGTVPFLLDEPGLQLTWQRQVAPPLGGKRLALLDPGKYPIVEVVIGEGIKARSFVNLSGLVTAFRPRFLYANAHKVWKGPEGNGRLSLWRGRR